MLRANVTAAEISALGTKNGVLPSAVAFGGASDAGLDGTPVGGFKSSLSGDIGTGLAQVFERDFPTERIGAFVSVPINNRQAEADYGVEQLQLRQTQLTTQKSLNQVIVDISNNVIAVRQARVRYVAAVKNRELQQQLLDAEQRKFLLGASTPYNVTQQQRDLATASATVLSALTTYSTARVALDQAMGTTLEANHVMINEAQGRGGDAAHRTCRQRCPEWEMSILSRVFYTGTGVRSSGPDGRACAASSPAGKPAAHQESLRTSLAVEGRI